MRCFMFEYLNPYVNMALHTRLHGVKCQVSQKKTLTIAKLSISYLDLYNGAVANLFLVKKILVFIF